MVYQRSDAGESVGRHGYGKAVWFEDDAEIGAARPSVAPGDLSGCHGSRTKPSEDFGDVHARPVVELSLWDLP